MKITIITACYNSVATIRDALESVAAQRVVDDWYLTDGERPEAIDIAAVRESALKSFAEVDDEDKRRIVCAIETTKVIPLRMPSDERLKRFIKGYWHPDRASEHVFPQGVFREVGRIFARLRHVWRLRTSLPIYLEEQGPDEVPADVHDRDAHGRSVDERLADDAQDQPVRFAGAQGQRLLVLSAVSLFALLPQDLGVPV